MLPACGKAREANASARVAAAGTVTQVSGVVTVVAAVGGAAPRPVAVGDVLASDDTLATGSAGRVDLRLAHNDAALHIDAGQTIRLDASLAWSLPPQHGTEPGRGSDRLASAGRTMENEAAHTMAPAATTAELPGPVRSGPGGQPLPVVSAPPTPPTPPPPRPEPTVATHRTGGLAVVGTTGTGVVGGGEGASGPQTDADAPVKRSTDATPAHARTSVALPAAVVAAVRACFASAAARDTIEIVVTTGAPAVTRHGGAASATEAACVAKAIGPLAAGRYTIAP